jgi:hypothetical protein
MKRSILAFSILLLAAVLCPAQQSKIVIRLLNGKNGHPIGDASVNVWLGDEISVCLPSARSVIR